MTKVTYKTHNGKNGIGSTWAAGAFNFLSKSVEVVLLNLFKVFIKKNDLQGKVNSRNIATKYYHS